MAEFTEVVRQAVRMCKANVDCETCPMNKLKRLNIPRCPCVRFKMMDVGAIDDVERAVMNWARENPEPVYPSWKDGWRALYPDAAEDRPPCPRYFMDEERALEYCNARCEDCQHRPMPADIAEKLDIKPIGGADK